ncbi:MAG: hypothetical protein E7034_02340 [Akkermansiaceae bacterium]|nr:hypothetical protein [Akkermansiaceae bacterium]
MRTVFFILACIIGWCYGFALAGTEREVLIKELMKRYPHSVFLPMPEAMVTEDKTGNKAEGLSISGDEEHVPTLYWEQQDMLRIDFPEGCRYQTEYKLEFPAEKAFFLNGQPLEETVYHLRCRPAAQKAVEVMGMERCSFLVTVAGAHHAEAQAFSPQSPVRYFFINEQGTEVPCRVMTAQMRHIQTDGHLNLPYFMNKILKNLPKRYQKYPETLTPDTPLPQTVLVQAEEELSTPGPWQLVARAEETSGFTSGSLLDKGITGKRALQSSTEMQYHLDVGPDSTSADIDISLIFNAPLSHESADRLLRELSISIDGKKAVPSEDETIRKWQGEDGTVTFQLISGQAQTEYDSDERQLRLSSFLGADEEELIDGYSFRNSTPDSLLIRVSGGLGRTVQLDVPVNISTAAGLKRTEPQRHTLQLHPACPQAVFRMGDGKEHSRGTWILKSMGISHIEVTAYRIPPEEIIRLEELLDAIVYSEGFEKTSSDEQICRTVQNIKAVSAAGTPRHINLTGIQGDSLPVETNLQREQLCKGLPSYGYYLLEINLQATEDICRIAPEKAQSTLYRVVNYTDISTVFEDETRLLHLLSRSAGDIIQSAEASIRMDDGPVRNIPSTNGGIHIPHDIRNGTLLVQHGDDYLCRKISYSKTDDSSSVSDKTAQLITDRTYYRPGDTVHVWGVLRGWSEDGHIRTPSTTQGKLQLLRGDTDILAEKAVDISPFGTFCAEFILPEGKDKSIGSHQIVFGTEEEPRLSSEYITCEEFRRHDFHATAELTLNRDFNPDAYTLQIEAKTLTGTPVSDGEAEITLFCGGHQETHTLPLSALGTAELRGSIPPSRDSNGRYLIAEISVRNERMEYHRIWKRKLIHCTDFYCRIEENGNVRTYDCNGMPLPRAQELQISVKAQLPYSIPTASGLTWEGVKKQLLFTEKVTVPAHAEEGVPLNLKPYLPGIKGTIRLEYDITGTDSQGRPYRSTYTRTLYSDEDNELPLPHIYGTSVTHGQLKQVIEHPFPVDCRAWAVLVGRQTHLIPVELHRGQKELSIPLPDELEGAYLCYLLLAMPENGEYRLKHARSLSDIRIERPERQLKVTLNESDVPLAPGSSTTVSGKVLRHDGTPCPAQVCLFAVDEGFLNLSPHDKLDINSIRTAFCRPHLHYPDYLFLNSPDEDYHFYRAISRQLECWTEMLCRKCSGDADAFSRQSSSLYDDISGHYRMNSGNAYRARALSEVAGEWDEHLPACSEPQQNEEALQNPRLRRDFNPVAFWCPMTETDDRGNFSAAVTMPDTLTRYRVFALAVGKDGASYGGTEAMLKVDRDVSLTAGTPLFMSVGDTLQLPVTVTNKTNREHTWTVCTDSNATAQKITLPAQGKGVLHFGVTAEQEGMKSIRWTAFSDSAGGDAVEVKFPVRIPVPELKEIRRICLSKDDGKVNIADFVSADMAENTQAEVSAHPLSHMSGISDFLLSYPYGCAEQTASALLPWLLHRYLSPFVPEMKEYSPEEVQQTVDSAIRKLLKHQQKDGGLSYWRTQSESRLWCSAYAALVLQIAAEQGFSVPEKPMHELRRYLSAAQEKDINELPPRQRYALGIVTDNNAIIDSALSSEEQQLSLYQANPADLRFLRRLRQATPKEAHAAFLQWMRGQRDSSGLYSTWQSGWKLIALHEFLKKHPIQERPAVIRLSDGSERSVDHSICRVNTETLQVLTGAVYATIQARASGAPATEAIATDRGLSISRLYEKQTKDGGWKKTDTFEVGDVIRVSLVCTSREERELNYLALEDYLPACMEAINPAIPTQAAGLQELPPGQYFDHREYHADRVRGFCTRVPGHNHVNMTYYARVKRAGRCTAPPAKAELMYEPGIRGLSNSSTIISQ